MKHRPDRSGARISTGILFQVCFLAATFLAGVASLWGQDSTTQILNSIPVLSNQCSGPLGSLLPECQTGKSAITIAPPAQSGIGSTAAPSVRGAEGKPAIQRDAEPLAAPVKSEPPTDFQRFVSSSVGQVLSIFGANLFSDVPTTFAPVDRVPVAANYTIGPGDELLLRVWGQVNLDLSLTVDRAGCIFIPQAGNISVAGLEFRQLPSYLKSQLGRVFRNFDLAVNMGQLRSIQIFVMGQARRPGAYTVSSLSTLVNALFASGGPSAQGSMRRIQLRRGADVQTEFDLYALLLEGDKSKDARLLPGDVVYIPPVGSQVAIAGSVNTPAVYELRREQTVGELIQMAGGLSAVADVGHATIERIKQRTARETIELRLDLAGMKAPLLEGDVLKVFTITPKFEDTVTLRGNVADPGRFPWHSGMRLRDVIPDKKSLITRDYWKKRNTLGFVAPQDLPAEPAIESGRKPEQTGIISSAPDINWSYAVIERQNPVNLSTDLIPFDLGRLVLESDSSQNLELRAGDVVTIFSQADFRVASTQQTRFVRLEGEFAAAGVYAARAGETLGQLIKRAGGLTPQAYLYGAEFTRESTRVDQQRRLDQFLQELEHDLERTASNKTVAAATPEQSMLVSNRLQNERTLLDRMRSLKATGRIVLSLDPDNNDYSSLMDFTLEDGDRFVVPSRPATVNVLGAVYNQNSFVYRPAQRVSDYLRQAGGETRNADSARTFIIRADGSVVPKRGFNHIAHSFDAARLNPGDSVVVPQVIFKGSFMQGLRDWTQVFSQLALGAAAINVLK